MSVRSEGYNYIWGRDPSDAWAPQQFAPLLISAVLSEMRGAEGELGGLTNLVYLGPTSGCSANLSADITEGKVASTT